MSDARRDDAPQGDSTPRVLSALAASALAAVAVMFILARLI